MRAEILIQNLRKKYPGGIEALKGINLEIEKGSFFTLLGPNGAGKSTLVKILTTLIDRDSGESSINGYTSGRHHEQIQRYIGVASQDNEIDPGENPEDLLYFQGRLFGLKKPAARERATELIELFQLSEERHKKAGNLSGGNKRRLHCALALVHKPEVLFLDEPTVGMDPLARSTFWDVITQMNTIERITVFLTTQYLEEAEKHARDMALIIEGEIRYSGTTLGFRQMVNPDDHLTLDESYLKYIRSLKNEVNHIENQEK